MDLTKSMPPGYGRSEMFILEGPVCIFSKKEIRFNAIEGYFVRGIPTGLFSFLRREHVFNRKMYSV
jgi:hypothetical protein